MAKPLTYVVGWHDTRDEFYVKGVTKSKKKADDWVKDAKKERFGNSRMWPGYVETTSI